LLLAWHCSGGSATILHIILNRTVKTGERILDKIISVECNKHATRASAGYLPLTVTTVST
jgi:hypothetical protein